MTMLLQALCAFMALEHVGFLVLEMFFWTTPLGLKVFGRTLEQAQDSAVLAGNQGLYNGFLAAGLAWSLVAPEAMQRPLQFFFLGCVLVAGIYGGFTAKTSILVVQALPAAIALAICLWGVSHQ